MAKDPLYVTLIQTGLEWENIDKNLALFSEKLDQINDATDLVVLPEMFTTGFSVHSVELAEAMNGKTMQWMAQKAREIHCCITGSMIIREHDKIYNRMIWMLPDGSFSCYDKRHPFSISWEDKHFTGGSQRKIFEYSGWRFCPQICYDLRFPVWSRNRGDYDALIYVANWPDPRRDVWNALLLARALENQAYTIGVNRTGTDGQNLSYAGDSQVIDPKGNILSNFKPYTDCMETIPLSMEELARFREKFPVGRDADGFELL